MSDISSRLSKISTRLSESTLSEGETLKDQPKPQAQPARSVVAYNPIIVQNSQSSNSQKRLTPEQAAKIQRMKIMEQAVYTSLEHFMSGQSEGGFTLPDPDSVYGFNKPKKR